MRALQKALIFTVMLAGMASAQTIGEHIGMNQAFHKDDPFDTLMLAVNMLSQSGTKIYRGDIAFHIVHPAPDSWDFYTTDIMVDSLNAHGIEILANLCYGYGEGWAGVKPFISPAPPCSLLLNFPIVFHGTEPETLNFPIIDYLEVITDYPTTFYYPARDFSVPDSTIPVGFGLLDAPLIRPDSSSILPGDTVFVRYYTAEGITYVNESLVFSSPSDSVYLSHSPYYKSSVILTSRRTYTPPPASTSPDYEISYEGQFTVIRRTENSRIPDGDTVYLTAAVMDTTPFLEYVDSVVSRYHNKVHYWAFWNEPDFGGAFWGVIPNPELYALLYNATYRKIKSIDPTVVVIAGNTTNNGGWFLRQLAPHIDSDCIPDGIGFHPYRGYPEDNLIPDMISLENWIQSVAGHEIPLWLTEFGWSTHNDVDSITQASYLVRTYIQLFSLSFVRGALWFCFRDSKRFTFGRQGGFGIVHSDLTPKPAYFAYSTMTQLLAESQFSQKIEFYDPLIQCFEFLKPDRRIRCIWRVQGQATATLHVIGDSLKIMDIFGNDTTIYIDSSEFTVPVFGQPIYVIDSIALEGIGESESPEKPEDVIKVLMNKGAVRIQLTLSSPQVLSLKIYNVAGAEVRGVARGRFGTGSHEFIWDGRDNNGEPVSDGVYLCVLRRENSALKRKFILLK